MANITTNGYLLDGKMVEKLYSFRIYKYQITLDGYSETHDKQRVLKNGGGTFWRIVDNILDIKENFRKKFLSITIRTNLTNEIMENSINEYIEFIKSHFAFEPMIDFRFRVAWESEQAVEKDIFIQTDREAYKYVYSLLKKVKGLNYVDELSEISIGGGVCYAAKENNFVIGSDGSIYKCTVHFEDDMNNIGYITEEGELIIDQFKYRYWTDINKITPECNNCASKLSCLGIGCPYNHGTGSMCNALNEQYDLILSVIAENLREKISIKSV